MANLTIVVDDKLLREARIKALQQGTSVNEICRQAIERFAAADARAQGDDAVAQLRALVRKAEPSPDGEPLWPGREALYETPRRAR